MVTWEQGRPTQWDRQEQDDINVQEIFGELLRERWASLVAELVKNLPPMWETWVQPLGSEDPWKRERLPIPVFWPREFQGLHYPWGCKESDTTELLSLSGRDAGDSGSWGQEVERLRNSEFVLWEDSSE